MARPNKLYGLFEDTGEGFQLVGIYFTHQEAMQDADLMAESSPNRGGFLCIEYKRQEGSPGYKKVPMVKLGVAGHVIS